MLRASLELLVALMVLGALGLVLFIVTGFGSVGAVIACVAAVFWWLRPGARKP